MRKGFFTFIAILFWALFLNLKQTQACTNVLITKGASADGSNMITYSADSHILYGALYHTPGKEYADGTRLKIYEWDTGKYLGEIDQVKTTYSTIGNMNEHQLIIAESTFGGREELVNPEGIMDYGSLIYITLQRAKTAREAIQIMDHLVQEYGYYSSGESFSIADKDEVWIMEMIGKGPGNKGAVWVAVRIPDGYISAHANQARITQFPLNDPENCLYSPDVISFAKEKGFYKGNDQNFSFSDAYAPLNFSAMRACEARVWSVFNKVSPDMEQYLDYALGENPKNRMPLYIKPDHKLTVKETADFMRDHYEGTPMDMTQDIGAGGNALPYRWRPMQYTVDGQEYLNERAIATQQTGFWLLGQARPWLPDIIGGILWFGVDDAATSCLTPIYTSSLEVPECFAEGNGHMTEYSPTSAFWLFNRVTNMAYGHYDLLSAEIKKEADKHELEALETIPSIDIAAQALYEKSPKKARKFLTAYSINTAQNMFSKWEKLDKYLLVKYIDGNVKKEDENGFLDNGNGRNIPAAPMTPGYNEQWKKAVASSTGDKLKVKEHK